MPKANATAVAKIADKTIAPAFTVASLGKAVRKDIAFKVIAYKKVEFETKYGANSAL